MSWDAAKPGDLAFFAVPGEREINHVGVVVEETDDGRYLVAHCTSKGDNVAITDAWDTGFRYIRRPVLLEQPNI